VSSEKPWLSKGLEPVTDSYGVDAFHLIPFEVVGQYSVHICLVFHPQTSPCPTYLHLQVTLITLTNPIYFKLTFES
jgi:hypothetical protein